MLESGDAMDQNADGTTDENPLNATQYPDGYTGLTPGDVYAVPTPQLTAPVTFTTAQSILSPPFNQNTLPLIISGPQVLTTQAVGTSGEGSTGSANLITNDSASQFDVTFDRPVQTSTFTASQVVSIEGPEGSVLGPQTFGSTSIDQDINAATTAGPGTLDSTLTVNSDNTLQIADITVTLTIAASVDSVSQRSWSRPTEIQSRCSRPWGAPVAWGSSTRSSTIRHRPRSPRARPHSREPSFPNTRPPQPHSPICKG